MDSKTYITRTKKSNEIKDIIDPHINSFLICLYQIERLIRSFENIANNQYTKTTNAFFAFLKNFGNNPFQSVIKFQNEMFNNKIKFDNYQNLIKTIISRANSELKQNTQNENKNTVYNTTQQYDENEAKKEFKKKNKNDSIFQQLFYSLKETISSCIECHKSTYIFEYIPFILIEDEEEKNFKLSDKILNSKIEEKIEKCNF